MSSISHAGRSLGIVAGVFVSLMTASAPLVAQAPVCRPAERVAVADSGIVLGPVGFAGAVLLSDGRVVVANRNPLELRSFGPDGSPGWKAGRSGQGPGEFRGIGSVVRLAGDSVAVFDVPAQRITVFSPSGQFVRVFGLVERAEGKRSLVTSVIGRSGGAWVLTSVPRGAPQVGLFRDTLSVIVYSERDSSIRQLGRYPGAERYGVDPGRGAPVVGAPLLGAGGFFAATGAETLLYADGRSANLQLMPLSGANPTARSAKGPFALVPLTPKLRSAAVMERLATSGVSAERQKLARPLQEKMVAEFKTFPSVAAIVGDSGGIWMRRYPMPGEKQQHWLRLDATNNRTVCSLTLPLNWQVIASGFGQLVVVKVDENDVPTLFLTKMSMPGMPAGGGR